MPSTDVPSSATAATLPLDDLQGNVANGYSFPAAHFSFWRITSDPERARSWLGRVLELPVTPGTHWLPENKPRSTLNVAFTHSGLAALGLDGASLQSFPPEYRGGMLAQAAELGDTGESAPERWDFGNAAKPVDVLLAIHGQTAQDVAQRLAALQNVNDGVLTEVHSLPAAALEPDPRCEHFGFRDGFGQPSIEGAGVESVPGQGTRVSGGWKDIKPGEFILGHEDESEGFPRALPQPAELARNGSFLVFRKLHQDVARFRAFLAQQAKVLRGADTHENREWIASRMVGRWRDGTPVALSPDREDRALADDWKRTLDFDYSDDKRGLRCPVGSHIRRVNPRAALPAQHLVRTHRLLRRGLPYGPPLPEGSVVDDGVARGVAFIALNASIQSQFRFVQKMWINDGEFAASGGLTSPDQDPITGPQDRRGRFQCFDETGRPRSAFDLPRFVQVRGGGYFFLPSLTGLRFLARGGGARAVTSAERKSAMFLSEFDGLATAGADPAQVARARAKLVSDWLQTRAQELFAELLDKRPTLLLPGLCVVTRAPDVREVLANDRVFTVKPYTARMERTSGAFILGMAGTPQYDRELSALRLAADRSDLDRVAAIARRTAEALVREAGSSRRLNLADGYARRVALAVIAEYYGTPGPDGATMAGWLRVLFRDIFLNLSDDPEVIAAAGQAASGLRGYLERLISEKRCAPSGAQQADDVLTRLAHLRQGDAWLLDEDGVRRNIGGVIIGALETVNKSFVHAFDQLLERPDALQRARNDLLAGRRAAVLDAVLEAMRFNPQNPFLYRTCEESFTLARGTERELTIPAGTLVFAATAAAMRDSLALPAPQEFRPGRPPESYLFFGHSMHVCFGQHVAPVELLEIAAPLLHLDGLRRAPGPQGKLQYEGPFPTSLWVEW